MYDIYLLLLYIYIYIIIYIYFFGKWFTNNIFF